MNRTLSLSKVQTRRTTSSKSSTSNKIAKVFGASFIALSLAGAIAGYYSAITVSDAHTGRKEVAISQPKQVAVHEDIKVEEPTQPVIIKALDQDKENERLVLQRDTERTIARHLKKPSNYRDGFTCTLTIKSDSLKKLDCEGNSVFKRSVELAIERAKLQKYSTSIEDKFTIQIRV